MEEYTTKIHVIENPLYDGYYVKDNKKILTLIKKHNENINKEDESAFSQYNENFNTMVKYSSLENNTGKKLQRRRRTRRKNKVVPANKVRKSPVSSLTLKNYELQKEKLNLNSNIIQQIHKLDKEISEHLKEIENIKAKKELLKKELPKEEESSIFCIIL